MSATQEVSCFLCCSLIPKDGYSQRKNGYRNAQMNPKDVTFVLKWLLQIPDSPFKDFVRGMENPYRCFQYCSQCRQLTRKSKATYAKMSKLLQKFESYQMNANKKLKNSHLSRILQTNTSEVQTYRLRSHPESVADEFQEFLSNFFHEHENVNKEEDNFEVKVDPDLLLEEQACLSDGYNENLPLSDNSLDPNTSMDYQYPPNDTSDVDEEQEEKYNPVQDSTLPKVENSGVDYKESPPKRQSSTKAKLKLAKFLKKKQSEHVDSGDDTETEDEGSDTEWDPNAPESGEDKNQSDSDCEWDSNELDTDEDNSESDKSSDSEMDSNGPTNQPSKEKSTERVYHCDLCDKSFNAAKQRLAHLHKKHPESMYSCKFCSKTYLHPGSLIIHCKTSHRERYEEGDRLAPFPEQSNTRQSAKVKRMETVFKCNQCGKVFENQRRRQKHMRNHHPDSLKHSCKYCGKKYSLKAMLIVHCLNCHPQLGVNESAACPLCGDNVINMEEHTRSVHRVGQNKCEICNKIFVAVSSLEDHRRGLHYKELNLEPHKCSECGKIFKHSKYVEVHEKKIHNKGYDIFCDICNAGAVSKPELEKHIRVVHQNEQIEKPEKPEKPVCHICGKASSNKYILQQHIETHNKHLSETLKCDECGKEFQGKRRLNGHKRLIHRKSPKPFVCEVCSASYPTKSSLIQHQRGSHFKELNLEPHKCNYCGMIFKSLSGRYHHEKNEHTKDWTYTCSEEGCNKGFFCQRLLDEHIRSCHTKETPFACEFCDKTFFIKRAMVNHMQYHTKNFNHFCHLCPKGFPIKWGLTIHLRKAHKIIPEKKT